ncbi:MAG: NYN domain-containing protein [Planctomycetes bacterium]|nr:NYN domain-containing protein [Planctomycetota bacterium]MBI3846003.1 NYN domain-containing protein [Planctomycetota bacterium]
MKCFVDGYNVLFSQDELRRILDTEGLDAARKRLLTGVAAHATLHSFTVMVVFDGSPEVVGVAREEIVQGVRCIYSTGQGKADRRILLLLDAEPQPGDCLVVTSDREVRMGARHRGAKVQAADPFWREATLRPAADKPGSRDGRLNKNEVDDWMRYFGFDSDEDA